jgi:hypothetical protein
VQTQQSIALINGLEKVLGKGSLFAYLVSMTDHKSVCSQIIL